jgi:hypothetical protein
VAKNYFQATLYLKYSSSIDSVWEVYEYIPSQYCKDLRNEHNNVGTN